MNPFDILFQLPLELRETIYKEWLQEYYISRDLVTSIKNMIVNEYYFKKMNVKFISNEELNAGLRKQILLMEYFMMKPVYRLGWDDGLHLSWEFGQKGLYCDYYSANLHSINFLGLAILLAFIFFVIGQYYSFVAMMCFLYFVHNNIGMIVTIKRSKRGPGKLYYSMRRRIL